MDRTSSRLTLFWLSLLLIGLQVWIICRAVVPAQDAVRFVAVAQAIERDGTASVWSRDAGPPLFSTAVAWVHRIFAGSGAGATGDWAASAQLVAAAALVAALVPFWLMTRRAFGERPALLAALCFCLLPEVVRLGADGLSDSMHLLLLLAAWWVLSLVIGRPTVRRRRQVALLFAAGLLLAIGVLSHRQAWLALVASAVAVALGQLIARRSPDEGKQTRQHAFGRSLAAVAVLVVGAGSVLLPYASLCSAGDGSQFVTRLVGRYDPDPWSVLNASSGDVPHHSITVPAERRAGSAVRVAAKETEFSSRRRGLAAAASEWIRETAGASQYWIGALALVGLIWRWRHDWRPLDAAMATFAVVWTLGVVWHASATGYLSTRHVLPPVVMVLPWSGVGLLRLIETVSAFRWAPQSEYGRRALRFAVVSAVLVPCLVRIWPPLHHSRVAHRQVAHWLASRSEAAAVLDSRGWSALYSGKTTYRMQAASQALSDDRLAYVVLEKRELHFGSRRARQLHELLAPCGPPVARFRHPTHPGLEDVVVYRRPAPSNASFARVASPSASR